MANFNRVILVGNLTRDPEIRYTPSGTAVAHFGLAVNRNYRTQDGDNREETCFVDITAWGRVGEIISEYVGKGDPILIEGRLQQESWETQEGQRRSKHSVVVENFQFLGRGGGGGGRGGSQQGQGSYRGNRQQRSGGGQGQQGPPQDDNGGDQAPPEDTFGGDDIPF